MLTTYSDVTCIVSNIPRPRPDEGGGSARVWSLSFKPDQDAGFLFPYINGSRDDALWYEHPEHVKFLFEEYRCLLYPNLATAHFFETRQGALDFIKRFMGFLDSVDQKKESIQPNFNQIRRVPVMDIFRLLPGNNCRECGFSTCMAFAAAVTKGKATADQCRCLARPMCENAVYPVFDKEGKLSHSVSLKIDTAELKQRIRDQDEQIRMLEAQLAPISGTHAPPPRDDTYRLPPLTDRELQILDHIARGQTNTEIGRHLFISPHTVKSHMINIFNKLNVSDRTQAAVKGVRQGLI
ncbi:MAG: hypothetical protein HUN04_18325 [Desulfobacter sp.]|nr:MAG: hypothetical protein HUN04_18325 [Desulfobacter sp.]